MQLNIDKVLRNYSDLQSKRRTLMIDGDNVDEIVIETLSLTLPRFHSKCFLSVICYLFLKELEKADYADDKYNSLRKVICYIYNRSII